MSLFDWFADRRKGQFVGKVTQESDESDGLWGKCPECSQVVYRKDLIANASVCSNCGHHNRIESQERINLIADPGSFKAFDVDLVLGVDEVDVDVEFNVDDDVNADVNVDHSNVTWMDVDRSGRRPH